ncbi:hypothetical protein [Algibacillus agarilyticus]|uniref:hypothetical protein n=1 Tax=Algibacillus agarilyticus TaxID=2234133 RepID=UPI000DCFCBC6|nr:hypothetical protein [Algibacillus agarilyticus]
MTNKKLNTSIKITVLTLTGITACTQSPVTKPNLTQHSEPNKAYAIKSKTNKKRLGTDCDPLDVQTDLLKPVNHGKLDDRSCKHHYTETTLGHSTVIWGQYEISENSSTDAKNSTRMERKFAPRLKPNQGHFHQFNGTFKIANVDNKKGTYFIQAKGKHIGSKGDPALALILAKKKIVKGELFFDIYSEQITKRGGRFSNNGRELVFIAQVKQHEAFTVEMKTGFTYQHNQIETHYVDVKINDKTHHFLVPSPKEALETGIRYGAYVVESGNAQVFVANTQFISG